MCKRISVRTDMYFTFCGLHAALCLAACYCVLWFVRTPFTDATSAAEKEILADSFLHRANE